MMNTPYRICFLGSRNTGKTTFLVALMHAQEPTKGRLKLSLKEDGLAAFVSSLPVTPTNTFSELSGTLVTQKAKIPIRFMDIPGDAYDALYSGNGQTEYGDVGKLCDFVNQCDWLYFFFSPKDLERDKAMRCCCQVLDDYYDHNQRKANVVLVLTRCDEIPELRDASSEKVRDYFNAKLARWSGSLSLIKENTASLHTAHLSVDPENPGISADQYRSLFGVLEKEVITIPRRKALFWGVSVLLFLGVTGLFVLLGTQRYRDYETARLKTEQQTFLDKEASAASWSERKKQYEAYMEKAQKRDNWGDYQRLRQQLAEEQECLLAQERDQAASYWQSYLDTCQKEYLDEYEKHRLRCNELAGKVILPPPDPSLHDLSLLVSLVQQGDYDPAKSAFNDYLGVRIARVEQYLAQSRAADDDTKARIEGAVTMARKLMLPREYTVKAELVGGWNHRFDVYMWGIWFSTQGTGAVGEVQDEVQEWSERDNRFSLRHTTLWAAGQPLRLSVYRKDYLMLKQRIGSFYYDDPLAIKHFCKRSNAHFTRDTVENRKMDSHSTDDFYAMEYRLSISCDGQEWGDEELALIQNVETYLISSDYWRKLLQQACERKVPPGAS